MASGHLRELVQYKRAASGFLTKRRKTVPCSVEPDPAHSVFLGHTSLYYSAQVFTPDGRFLPTWGVIMITAIMYQALVLPYSMAFSVEDTTSTLVLDFLCTLVYMLDIAFSCNTGYYTNGRLVSSRRAIIGKYIRTWLVWDLISTFPYNWLFESPFDVGSQHTLQASAIVRVVKIGRLLRSLRLMRIAKVKSHFFRLQQKLVHSNLAFLLTSVSLLGIMGIIAHWVACGFYYISQVDDLPNNWVQTATLQDSQAEDIYVAAIYWAITTLTTTGYGDIRPISLYEKVYAVLTMVFSAAFFSVIIGKIGMAIAMVDRDAQHHKTCTQSMNRYLRKAQVPPQTIYRALRYMDYVWETRKTCNTFDKNLLNSFSEPLKKEISEHIYGPVMAEVGTFGRFEGAFRSQLAKYMETEIFAPDDVIFQSGDSQNVLYFIEKGKVELFHQETAYQFVCLKVKDRQKGDNFGEIAFFTGRPRCTSAKCLKFSGLLALNRTAMMSIMTPATLLTLNQTMDLYLSKQHEQLGLKCYCCGAAQHIAPECPEAIIHIDREKIQRKWLERRQYHSKVLKTASVSPNFCRTARKVHRVKRYTLASVQSPAGFQRLKGASYMLTKRLASHHAAEERSVEVQRPEHLEDMEFCPLSSEGSADPDHSSSHSEEILLDALEDSFVHSRPLHTFPGRGKRDEGFVTASKSDVK